MSVYKTNIKMSIVFLYTRGNQLKNVILQDIIYISNKKYEVLSNKIIKDVSLYRKALKLYWKTLNQS